MKRIGMYLVAVLVPTTLMLLGSAEARAQFTKYKGKIVLTQKPLPAKQALLAKFLRKNATGTLKSEKGGGKWKFHFFAVLRKSPPTDVVNIVFYEYRGGRYRYVNAEDLKISTGGDGLITVTGKYKVYKILGFKAGGRYQMRLAVKNARGNEVVYARSRVITLKK